MMGYLMSLNLRCFDASVWDGGVVIIVLVAMDWVFGLV